MRESSMAVLSSYKHHRTYCHWTPRELSGCVKHRGYKETASLEEWQDIGVNMEHRSGSLVSTRLIQMRSWKEDMASWEENKKL